MAGEGKGKAPVIQDAFCGSSYVPQETYYKFTLFLET